ncbi:hypothetical protein LCGC14_2605590, partial [marine sediment metagenome]
KLDTLIRANGKAGGGVTRGQLFMGAAIVTGLFGLIETLIAVWK